MRIWILALCLSVCVSCSLVEPQYVALSPEQVAVLEAKLGDLGSANAELLRVEVERLTGMQVESVAKFRSEVLAKLTPPAQEAGEAVATTLVDKLIENPTASGALAALLGALGIGAEVLRRRMSASKTKKKAATTPVVP
ncbi:MAG: hypothetical protein V2A73_21305 [Pseudomonadota bacterium]